MWLKKYRLTPELSAAIAQVVKLGGTAGGEALVGGAIVLKVADEYQTRGRELSAGKLAMHGALQRVLHHPASHGGELAATHLRLNAPSSRSKADGELWYYSQGPRRLQATCIILNDWRAEEISASTPPMHGRVLRAVRLLRTPEMSEGWPEHCGSRPP